MAYTTRTRYSGAPSMGGLTPAVKWLLIANTAVFLVSYLFRPLGETLFGLFGLTPFLAVQRLMVWQLVSYLFLHDTGGFTHILFNMLTLWMFGTPLESVWGTRRFLRFYLLCGIGAGLAVLVLNYGLPGLGSTHSTTIGASGAIYGLLVAFGMLFPEARILFFFLFPIPARIYVWIMGAIVFLSTLGGTGGTVSHIAHLGGMVAGFIIVKMGWDQGRPTTRRGASLLDTLAANYRRWKLERAKRKFQVYLRKHGQAPRDDRWVN